MLYCLRLVIRARTQAPIALPSSPARNSNAVGTVELNSVCKSYGGFVAVDNLFLCLHPAR
jgi:hypothetical protein